MSRKLRVAVVGMGLQGQRLVRALGASKHAVLAGTASERERGSFAALLKDKTIDVVVIATPNGKHAKQAITAARAGKHILCEKPLALTARQGRAVRAAAKKSGVRCFVNYHLRMHPEAQKAKKLIAQGSLGEVVYIEMLWAIGTAGQKKLPPLPLHMRWRESVKAGGGTTSARGVHLFDFLRFITGKEAVRVSGYSDKTRTAADQTAVAVIGLEGGAVAAITTSKVMPGADNRIAIMGTKGKLVLRDIFTSDPQALYTDVFDALAKGLSGAKTPLATAEDGIAADTIAQKALSLKRR